MTYSTNVYLNSCCVKFACISFMDDCKSTQMGQYEKNTSLKSYYFLVKVYMFINDIQFSNV